MVCVAFSFCWLESADLLRAGSLPGVLEKKEAGVPATSREEVGREKTNPSKRDTKPAFVARSAQEGEVMAGALRNSVALLEGVLGSAPASGAKSAA